MRTKTSLLKDPQQGVVSALLRLTRNQHNELRIVAAKAHKSIKEYVHDLVVDEIQKQSKK